VRRYLGLDLHTRYIHGCERRAHGPEPTEQHFRFPNTPEGWALLLDRVDQICWVALEVTGSAFEVHDRLSPITGVGLIAAAALWAVLGDPRRFTHPRQVTRYVGLDPSVTQSGETDQRGRISKNGSRLLRTLLIDAAPRAARQDTGLLGEYYAHKRAQIGAKKATAALARKPLLVAWRMLLTGEVYRAAKLPVVTRKHRAV
jgi:transposase